MDKPDAPLLSAVRRRPQDAKRLMELCGGDISKLEGPMVSQAAQEGDVLGLYAFGKIGECLGRTRTDRWGYVGVERYA